MWRNGVQFHTLGVGRQRFELTPVSAQHPACAQPRRVYHKLVRAVAYANGGKLRVRTDQEQQLWSECSRLLTNCIIYYNACILSELLERAERRQDYQPTDAIKRANPASWKHVDLYGGLQLPGYRRWGRPPGIGQSLGGGPR